jgi:hypothetical protein
MNAKLFALSITLLALGATTATAGCYEPSVPGRYSKPTKPTPPSKPFCAGAYGGRNTCSDWEVSSYNSAVSSYNSDMETYRRDSESYVRKLKQYLEDAQSYAICEVKSLDR